MAQKKTTASEKAKNHTGSAKRGAKTQTKPAGEPARERKAPDPGSALHKFLPYVFVLLAVLIVVFLILSESSGVLGNWIGRILSGAFGPVGAWLIPVILVIFALRWKKIVGEDAIASRFLFSFLFLCSVALIAHTFSAETPAFEPKAWLSSVGGAVGGFLSFVFSRLIGKIGTLIVGFVLAAVSLMFLLTVSLHDVWIYLKYSAKVAAEKREEKRERREAQYAAAEEELRRREEERKRAMADAEALEEARRKAAVSQEPIRLGIERPEDYEPDPALIRVKEEDRGEEVPEEPEEPAAVKDAPAGKPEQKAANGPERRLLPDLEEIFGAGKDADALMPHDDTDGAEGELDLPVSGAAPAEAKPKPKPVYRFPPITLLKTPEKPKKEDLSAELNENAKKLVDTLNSFHVHTRVSDYTRGPTITRYELSPEMGTSVRSISNRVDDIALSLATLGVRIEAPIPGKAAVGIEVPNKIKAIVYLRELIASKQFTCEENKGKKLFACLGSDVGGAPVFCDISKMPHLLIAGATGMGKSVCINSIIISLLYRSTPQDLRFILIDPKRVEFAMYNGIPHLLVPVVTEPQMAAGALSWAVNEMERRFGLIQEVGVRDIAGYNATVTEDSGYEKLPNIVIIIDELADLMIAARDTVEVSVNRLAAKARAAGIHIIIGTQRPSVDVVTGVIKANIPSRIAFTVASQVDSKTIIDVGGAEKLIGRGDMLYAPVGLIKPMRVQGAFVSDGEVEAVTTFVRENSEGNEYSEEAIAGIARETQNCQQNGKKGSAAEDEDFDGENGDLDPKFREALEIAVQNQKIATSMLQRALKVGYGRAARIIDDMERFGYVGPPDGTKPRKVLIDMQQYRELVVNDNIAKGDG
ncbi:MAG: DNA translocase FtsK [Clostridia bacterium]|nr:DNA translocase FtsK [Clostridia bacterium]